MALKLPVYCPACTAPLKVHRLECTSCETAVEGRFPLSAFDYLSSEEQAFVMAFVKSSGSLKQMASQLKLSYPSVRNMLDDLIARVGEIENQLTQIQD